MTLKSMYGIPISLLLNQFIFTILLVLVLFFIFYHPTHITLRIFVLISAVAIGCYVYYFQPNQFHKKRKQVLIHMLKASAVNGSETILDLGTGAGYVAIGFAKKLNSGKVYGLDKYHLQSEGFIHNILDEIKINFIGNSLDHANKNAISEQQEKKISFHQVDLTKTIPFQDNYFDIALSSQFLYCLSHQKLPFVLSEIHRVLKPKGKIIFFESNKFMKWDINKVIRFFKDKGYEIEKNKVSVFKNKSIIVGIKN
jgi:ubiquinone/menaquinone biosynthesis C-methylase UbiE